MKQTIVLCGSYGNSNLGDRAILRMLLKKHHKSNVIVMCGNPTSIQDITTQTIPLVPAGIRSIAKSFTRKGKIELKKTKTTLNKADRFILGGGTLLTDQPWKALLIWAIQVTYASRHCKSIELEYGGIGPIHSWWGRQLTKHLLKKFNRISTRDAWSTQTAKQLGAKQVITLFDPVLEWKKPARLSKRQPKILLVPCPTRQDDKTAKVFVEFIKKRRKAGLKVEIMGFQAQNKREKALLEAIQAPFSGDDHVQVWTKEKGEKEAIERIYDAKCVIGMRLHSLIFAEAMNTPYIGIAYAEKVSAFAESLQKSKQIIELTDLTVEKMEQAYQGLTKGKLAR